MKMQTIHTSHGVAVVPVLPCQRSTAIRVAGIIARRTYGCTGRLKRLLQTGSTYCSREWQALIIGRAGFQTITFTTEGRP